MQILLDRRRIKLSTAQKLRQSLVLLYQAYGCVRQVAAATDKVFYHIFLTCKCFMVINVRWLRALFYVVARYQSSLFFAS